MANILLIESDNKLATAISYALNRRGHRTLIVRNEADALIAVKIDLARAENDKMKTHALLLGETLTPSGGVEFLLEAHRLFGRINLPAVIFHWQTAVQREKATRSANVDVLLHQGSPVPTLLACVEQAVRQTEKKRKKKGSATMPASGLCECGAKHTSFPGRHYSWCPAGSQAT